MTTGVDYAWSHPSPAALKAAGVRFAMRYLSTDAKKSLTRTEATALAAAGVWSGVVWETTADRALAGKAAGVADAKAASTQAAACGMPASRPIYFAVDFDATPAQQTAINAYLAATGTVLGPERVGVYGGYYVVKRALDAGVAKWAWQTMAWSGGQWDTRAHIRQTGTVTIGGVRCDRNQAMTSDYGQWMPGKTPKEEPVALTAADAKTIWTTDGITKAPQPPVADPDVKTNPMWKPANALADTQQNAREANANTAKLLAEVAVLQAKVDALTAALAGLNANGLLDQLTAGLAGIQLTLNVQETQK